MCLLGFGLLLPRNSWVHFCKLKINNTYQNTNTLCSFKVGCAFKMSLVRASTLAHTV